MTHMVQELIREGQVEFEGLILVYSPDEIAPGDVYLAQRNTGPKLLTCAFVKMGAVFPEETDYPYDLHECARVVLQDENYKE